MNKNIEKLQAATALVTFENTLKSASNTVAYFGAIFAFFGIVSLVRFGISSSWSALAISAVLLGESFYIRHTRSPRALWLSGMSFAVFAAWLLGSFFIGLAKHDPSQAKGVIAGTFLAIGAWNILRSYSAYKALMEMCDPSVNVRVRDAIEELRMATLAENTQIVEFKKRGIGEGGTWRLQLQGDFFLICEFADKTFGFGGRPQQAAYIPRHDVAVQNEGNRWIGKDVNVNLSISGAENKIQLKPEMLTRLESMLTGDAGHYR